MIAVLPSNHIYINAIKYLVIFTSSIFMVLRADAQQNMVISNTGQTGTNGTNWSTSGSNPVTITGTGPTAINTSVITGYLNAGTSVILNNLSVGTAINSDILKTSGGNASLTVKDLGNIKVNAGVTISSSSNRLDIILWSDDDNNQGGTVDDFMYITQGVTLNSNGGKIVLAGGPDDGSNGGVNGDGIPDGFPWNGSNSTTYGANTIGGLTLGIPGGTGPVITLSSSGGDIILRGSTSNNNGYPGITSQGNLKIDAGAGRITIYGKTTSGQGIELSFGAAPAIAINSSSTTSPAIDIKGTTSATGFAGFFACNNNSGNILIQSTAASGGGISIEGINPTGYGILLGISGTSIASQIISQSGSIALKGKGTTNTSLVLYGDSYIGNRKDATPVQGITPAVTASQSNLLFQGDDQWKFSNTAATNTNISTSGSLSLEAYTAGYTGLVNWTGTAAFGSSFSNITMGKATENYSFTPNNSLSALGNITAYATNFSLPASIGLSSTGAGNISINTDVLSIASSGTISSSGNLNIAPKTAGTTIGLAGFGTLSLTATNFTTNFADGFASINIGNSTAGAITLGGILTVRDNWQLTTAGSLFLNETLDINANNLRFIGPDIIPAGGKFIKTNGTGKLTMDIAHNGTKLFPIGVSSYNPLSITNHIGNADTFSATVSDNVYGNGSTSGTSVAWNPRVNLTWNISNAGTSTGAGTVDLQFGWNAANETGVFSAPRLLNYIGTSWSLLPATPASDLIARSLTYTGYTGNFASFAIAESNALLPVDWLLFNGKQNGNSVEIVWATAASTNNDHFEVQHSQDGIGFNTIGGIKAYSTFSNDRQDYSFSDNIPFAPRTFYRIKQVDIDGKSSYSKIIVVQAQTIGSYQVTHTTGTGQLLVSVPPTITGTVTLSIADVSGRIILQQAVSAGQTVIYTDGLLPGGIYVVNLRRGANIVYSMRLLK